MFIVNDDLSIYATRGDIVCLNVSATDDRTGEPYEFQPGDILQMKIYVKKDAENVVLQKDFPVPAKTNTVGVFLTESDTKFGDIISKPTDYWYEVTLNPYTNPQTFIGYDEDGAKIFKLFPEGNEVEDEDEEITEEDIPVVDADLSLLSNRPVENRAIARAVALVRNDMELMDKRLTGKIKENKKAGETVAEELAVERARIDNLVASPTPGDSELVDIRVGADGVTYDSAGTAVREQIKSIRNSDLQLKQRVFCEYTPIELPIVEGAYDVVNKTVYSSSDMRYAIYNLDGEKILKFSGYSHGQPEYYPAAAFLDGEGTIINKFGENTANTSVSEFVTVPSSAVQIVINGRKSVPPTLSKCEVIDSDTLLKELRSINPSRLDGYEVTGTAKEEVELSEDNTTLLLGLYDDGGTFNLNDNYSSVVYPISDKVIAVDLSNYIVGTLGGAFLDINKEWIKSFSTEASVATEKTVPEGACYIAITAYANNPYKTISVITSTYKLNGLDVGNQDRIKNVWGGKKVVWIGTSVPFGAGAGKSYASECADYLGFDLVNCSVPSIATHTKEDGTSLYGGSLVLSKAEYLAQGVTIEETPLPFVPGGSYNNHYTTWENVFCSDNADADLFVFDVVPNNTNFSTVDWDAFDYEKWAYKDGSSFADHRTTFLGSLLFLMDKMYELNENARMVLLIGSSFTYSSGRSAFLTVKDKWKMPMIDLWGKINASPKSVVKMYSNNGTDPHPSAFAHEIMGRMLVGELQSIG